MVYPNKFPCTCPSHSKLLQGSIDLTQLWVSWESLWFPPLTVVTYRNNPISRMDVQEVRHTCIWPELAFTDLAGISARSVPSNFLRHCGSCITIKEKMLQIHLLLKSQKDLKYYSSYKGSPQHAESIGSHNSSPVPDLKTYLSLSKMLTSCSLFA